MPSTTNYFIEVRGILRPSSDDSSVQLFLISHRYKLNLFWKYFSLDSLTFLFTLFRFWLFNCLDILSRRYNLKYLDFILIDCVSSDVNQGLFILLCEICFFFRGKNLQ